LLNSTISNGGGFKILNKVTVSATQMSCTWNVDENIKKAEKLIREAKSKGANIILLQELFERKYFCQVEKLEYYDFAKELMENKAVNYFMKLAKELNVVLPISFYERSNNVLYNSIAVIDADGEILGIYRKTHIPDGPGYEEKFYFSPGDTGFRVWNTKFAKIGVAICWDQWFPESARSMAIMGADILFYPTAIGSEPEEDIDSKDHWQICMQGHSGANIIPVVASNRIGKEKIENSEIDFYGSSFITDYRGNIVREGNRKEECVLTYEFDIDEIRKYRLNWGVFRDRRPHMYKVINTKDGNNNI
jgi:N-carbamoylputrescine amidase